MPEDNPETSWRSVAPFNSEVYATFLRMAKEVLSRRRDLRDPSTMSLVDDVLLGVLEADQRGALPEFENDEQLLKYLSRCIRNHLATLARRRLANRRPPDERRIPWPRSRLSPATQCDPAEVIDVNDALEELARKNQQLADVVEMIFFGGCSQAEVAEAIGRTVHQVRADWEFARAWLERRLRN